MCRTLVYERQAKTARRLMDKIAFYLEARHYQRFEKNSCKQFDLALTVSPADEIWMRKNYDAQNVRTAILPVDGDYFSPQGDIQEKESLIVFTGT